MSEDKDSKTEDPTDRKLEKAREDGQVPVSMEVNTWGVLLAATLMVALLSNYMFRGLRDSLSSFIGGAHAMSADFEGLRSIIVETLLNVGIVMIFPIGLLIVAALAVSMGQVGILMTPKKIQPKLSNISPISGAKRLFSGLSMMEFGKGILKLCIVGAIGTALVMPALEKVELLAALHPADLLDWLKDTVLVLMAAVVGVMTFIAVADLAYQRWQHGRDQRMSKQEVRDEHKQSEGDPLVKGRLRSLRLQRARQRMMQSVPDSDVVVTNPTHFAVAMKYDAETMNAPVVVAKGQDLIALRIRQIAEENDVPIVENAPLARALHASVELDQEVPPEHYKAVAEVISYVMGLKDRFAR